jgi:hypothetical protein
MSDSAVRPVPDSPIKKQPGAFQISVSSFLSSLNVSLDRKLKKGEKGSMVALLSASSCLRMDLD